MLHISSQIVQSAQAAGALNSIKLFEPFVCVPTNGQRRSFDRSHCHCAKNAKNEDAFDENEFSMLLFQRWLRSWGQMLNKLKVNRMLKIHSLPSR